MNHQGDNSMRVADTEPTLQFSQQPSSVTLGEVQGLCHLARRSVGDESADDGPVSIIEFHLITGGRRLLLRWRFADRPNIPRISRGGLMWSLPNDLCPDEGERRRNGASHQPRSGQTHARHLSETGHR